MRSASKIGLGLALGLGLGSAHADPLDELGFGAAETGVASSDAATVAGVAAAHANPAGLARAVEPEVMIGYQYSLEHLQIDGHDAGVTNSHGTTLGLDVPIDLGPVRVATGVALYLPDQFLARIELDPIAEPHFVRLENVTQRVEVEPSLALQIGDFAIGGGATFLADARSKQLTFDVGVIAGQKQGDANLDVGLPLRAAPHAGVWWRPHRKLELAATVRGAMSLDTALDIRANVSVPGVVTGDAIVSLRSTSYYTPLRADLAAAVHATEELTLTADVAFQRWHALGSGVPDLKVLVDLSLAPPLVQDEPPPAHFHDIVEPRLGAEWHRDELRLRAGFAYLPSPVPPQTGLTSFADGDRTLAALGAGWRLPSLGPLAEPVDIDVALAWQHVMHELVQKEEDLIPGGAFSAGGDIVQATVSATVRF